MIQYWWQWVGLVVGTIVFIYLMIRDWKRTESDYPMSSTFEDEPQADDTDIERIDYAQYRLKKAIAAVKQQEPSSGKDWFLAWAEAKLKECECWQYLHIKK